MQGLLNGNFPWDKSVEAHLGHCLGCLSCEAICPSKVPYGHILDGVKNLYQTQLQHGLPWFLPFLIEKPKLRNMARWLIFLYQRSGIQTLLRSSGILSLLRLSKLEEILVTVEQPNSCTARNFPRIPQKGKIALFTGCINPVLDNQTIHHAISLLQLMGYEVVVPPQQQCCGALYLHSGQKKRAMTLLKKNCEVFAPFKTTVFLATGCGAQLLQNQEQMDSRFIDISQFLYEKLGKQSFKPLCKKIALHIPCSQKNVVHSDNAVFDLLKKIPQLDIIPMNNEFCCGAGGMNMLHYPELGSSLRTLKFQDLDPDVEIIASSNIGCSLHLKADTHLPIVHPLSLLAQQFID